MSRTDRVLLHGSSCAEATFCSVVNHWVSFLFCFVSIVLFLSGLILIFGGIQCRSGLPGPLCVLPTKGDQLVGSNAHGMATQRQASKPAMAKLETGVSA